MNQLKLVLSEPIESLAPKLIEFNNVELMTAAKNMLEAYRDVEYDENMMAQAKEDRATLNKFCKALDDGRKDIKRVYESPLIKFTAEVNDVIIAIKEVSDKIGERVSEVDNQRKQERRKRIEEVFDNEVGELIGSLTYDKIHQDRWLNSTVKESCAIDEMKKTISKVREEIKAIRALKSDRETTLLALYFRNLSLAETLTESQRIESEKKRVKEFIKSLPESPILPLTESIKVIRFEVEGTSEQFTRLREFLLDNKIIYRSIKEN